MSSATTQKGNTGGRAGFRVRIEHKDNLNT